MEAQNEPNIFDYVKNIAFFCESVKIIEYINHCLIKVVFKKINY
jgi:hypothetical protein